MPAAQWIGSDYVLGPLVNLAGRLPHVPLLHFDLTQCPLPDSSVDGVVLLNVLEHIEEDAAAVGQVLRILRPGGLAVVEVPAGPELFDVYDELLMHYRRYTRRSLTTLLEGAGFEVLRLSHLGVLMYPPFYVVKRWNRRYLSREEVVKRKVVGRQIRSTAGSSMLSLLLRTELTLGTHIRWPFGIRCVAVARKRASCA
jgi:SAM-dependent methyltransferase